MEMGTKIWKGKLLKLLTLLWLQAASGNDVNCSSHHECLATLARVTSVRQEKEAEALRLLGVAKIAFEKASLSEEQSKGSLARAQRAETEQARWEGRQNDLQTEVRLLEKKLQNSSAALKEAEAAEQREVTARIDALKEKKHQQVVSGQSAQERCLENFASCTAGLMALQVQQWMDLLHIFNRLFIALGSIALGLLLLLLPAEGQAVAFAAFSLLALPVLVSEAFKDFLRLVGSPPAVLVGLAGLLTLVIAVAFLWQGADGLRLLLGAGLAVAFGDLLLVVNQFWLPSLPILMALVALGLGFCGSASGLYRQQATQAFAMAMPAALLVASGAMLLFCAPLSEAYLEDVAAALMPTTRPLEGEKLGGFFCECGRLLWLLLQLPALFRLLTASADVPSIFPWRSEFAEQKVEPEAAQTEHSRQSDAETGEAAEEEFWTNEVAARQAAPPPATPPAAPAELDPVATTQLLQRTVDALQALERALPPRAEEMPPPTHLAPSGNGR